MDVASSSSGPKEPLHDHPGYCCAVIAAHRSLTEEQKAKLWAPLIALGLVLLLAYLVM